ANLLVLDEPTNDLDLVTLELLEEVLLDFDGSVVIVSHDRYFLDKVATSILAFEGDGRAVLYAGNYEMYARLKAQSAAEAPAEQKRKGAVPASAQPAPAAKEAEKGRALSYKERVMLEQMEALIEAAENEKARLEAALADPELYRSRAGEVEGLKAALDKATADVERLYATWQDLESRA
ncbi:MAG: ABC transporter ATP-binding protein, partial [Myxococcales bacterium]